MTAVHGADEIRTVLMDEPEKTGLQLRADDDLRGRITRSRQATIDEISARVVSELTKRLAQTDGRVDDEETTLRARLVKPETLLRGLRHHPVAPLPAPVEIDSGHTNTKHRRKWPRAAPTTTPPTAQPVAPIAPNPFTFDALTKALVNIILFFGRYNDGNVQCIVNGRFGHRIWTYLCIKINVSNHIRYFVCPKDIHVRSKSRPKIVTLHLQSLYKVPKKGFYGVFGPNRLLEIHNYVHNRSPKRPFTKCCTFRSLLRPKTRIVFTREVHKQLPTKPESRRMDDPPVEYQTPGAGWDGGCKAPPSNRSLGITRRPVPQRHK